MRLVPVAAAAQASGCPQSTIAGAGWEAQQLPVPYRLTREPCLWPCHGPPVALMALAGLLAVTAPTASSVVR